MKFSIGCDPEIFLVNEKGEYRSSIGLIGGDKWNPRKITEVGHALLEDNVSVEFNIPACETFEAFKKEIKFTLEKIKEIVPQNLQFSKESAVSFPDSELNCPEAWLFGCEPDFNAWTGEANPKPLCPDMNLRSCGGHIHVGSDVAISSPRAVVRAMDLFLGCPSINIDKYGAARRKLYGGAGAHRKKSYGVEYRTLSNFWIFNDSLIHWAYQGTQRALEFVASGNEIPEEHGKLIQKCINEGDMESYGILEKSYGTL